MLDLPEFSRPFALDKLGAGSEEVSLEAGPAEREALAKRLGLLALERFGAELTVTGKPDLGLVLVSGRLKALVRQRCVVTLAPFDAWVEERFEQSFRLDRSESEDEEGLLSLDLPEPLPADGLDLGEELTQQLSLALPPFPRSPGAALPAEAQDPESTPFAALRHLRDGREDKSDG